MKMRLFSSAPIVEDPLCPSLHRKGYLLTGLLAKTTSYARNGVFTISLGQLSPTAISPPLLPSFVSRCVFLPTAQFCQEMTNLWLLTGLRSGYWLLTWHFLWSISLYHEVNVDSVLTLTPVISDSFFDSPLEPVSCVSSIAEWRKDIPAPIVSEEDFFYSPELQDMNGSDLFELKDTISECSMDSAYQSQSGASRRGVRKPDGSSQDNRPRMNAQFVGSEIYSPTLSAESYNFTDQAMDMNQMRQPSGTWETPEDSIVYANYSAGQDYSQYTNATVSRYTPASNVGISSPWVSTDAQFHTDNFSFNYPAGQSPAEMMFSNTASSQRPWSNSHFDGVDRPTAVRTSSSYTLPQDSRRTSAHDATFNAFVATPTSTTSVQFPHNVEFDQSRLMDSRTDNEDAASTSVPARSLEDNEDIMSASDAAEIKLEEERTKVARSHPLYSKQPDTDGKYHCPEEGQAGCTHKPTALKCNYE
jgi:hypothetical protein